MKIVLYRRLTLLNYEKYFIVFIILTEVNPKYMEA